MNPLCRCGGIEKGEPVGPWKFVGWMPFKELENSYAPHNAESGVSPMKHMGCIYILEGWRCGNCVEGPLRTKA